MIDVILSSYCETAKNGCQKEKKNKGKNLAIPVHVRFTTAKKLQKSISADYFPVSIYMEQTYDKIRLNVAGLLYGSKHSYP
jgi:hypothetical protein